MDYLFSSYFSTKIYTYIFIIIKLLEKIVVILFYSFVNTVHVTPKQYQVTHTVILQIFYTKIVTKGNNKVYFNYDIKLLMISPNKINFEASSNVTYINPSSTVLCLQHHTGSKFFIG